MRFFVVISVVLLLIGIPSGAIAQQSTEGMISGQVFNGTEGGGSVGGVVITLLTYVDNMLSDTRTTEADPEGKFQFRNVNIEHSYVVSARYMDVDYYYPVTFESGETTVYVEVGVCDTTTSDDKIRVGLTRKIVNIDEESLLVTEVYWLANDGDRTYLGADGVLFFHLPSGSYCFAAPDELMTDYQLSEDNVVSYLVPFPPGDRQLIYSYRLAKPDSHEIDLTLAIDYPSDIVELMVQSDDIEVSVSQLAPAEPIVTDTGERYIYFQGKNFSRNDVINVRLFSISMGNVFPWYVLGIIAAVAIAGMAVYMVVRKRKAGNHE